MDITVKVRGSGGLVGDHSDRLHQGIRESTLESL